MNARHINTDTPLRYALAIGDAVTREIASPGGCRSPERRLAAWLFKCLGMAPGDTLDDLYPGTGVISRAWSSLSSEYSRDALERSA